MPETGLERARRELEDLENRYEWAQRQNNVYDIARLVDAIKYKQLEVARLE
jgi:hypothetical protein